MLKLIKPLIEWKIVMTVVAGVFTGLVLLVIYVSRAHSYLSDKPETCANCHIMAPQYITWSRSSHRIVAHCNDCHVPHNNELNKYYFKAKDGLRHATIFTLRKEPQVIFIKHAGRDVVQDNCIRCHNPVFFNAHLKELAISNQSLKMGTDCLGCHREVPHGRVNSLSSSPFAKVPLPGSPVPQWLNKMN